MESCEIEGELRSRKSGGEESREEAMKQTVEKWSRGCCRRVEA